MTRRFVTHLAVLLAAALVLAELVLRPAGASQRWQLIGVIAGPALVTAALVPVLRRWVSSRSSVAGAALAVGLCSLLLATVTTSAASNAMFLSSHDYRLFLVVLGLSTGIALAVGAALSRPLAADIATLGHTAERVARGDLSLRTGITRRDEVGQAARAVDRMVDVLDAAARERSMAAAARQQLFASIGHDLRTPLAAMRAAVESLQDGVAPDPRRYLSVISSHIDALEGLLAQFSEFARIEHGLGPSARELVSVTELAHETVEALCPIAHRVGVDVTIESDSAAKVRASAVDVSRVLRNLVENAIRHTPCGGSVRVSVSASGSRGVEVTVADSGAGFPDDFRSRAFEPFTRADPARSPHTGHAGLGLAISRALVLAHGGDIWLGDGPGGDVHVAFPAAKEQP